MMDMKSHVSPESFQPSTLVAARLTEKVMKDLLGVRRPFETIQIGNVQGLTALRIPGSLAQRDLIEKQPGFLHPHRNHTHYGGCRLPALSQCFADLLSAMIDWCSFGIPMNEQQFTRIKINTQRDAIFKSLGRMVQAAQVRQLRLQGKATIVLAQQPHQNWQKCPVRWSVRDKCKAKTLHSEGSRSGRGVKKGKLWQVFTVDDPSWSVQGPLRFASQGRAEIR